MSKKKDNDDVKLILEDYQEIEDYRVDDVFDMIEEEEEQRRSRKRNSEIKKNNKRKKRRKLKIFLLVLEIFVVLILGLVATFMLAPKDVRNKMISCAGKCVGSITGIEQKVDEKFHDSDFDKDKVEVNEELDLKNYEDYYTIALFGIDTRDNELNVGRSDSIIIVTVNMKSGEVRMCSVARDTYLSVVDEDGDVSYNKINAAFNFGGVELAISNLNRNLDISIDEYVVVNFAGLATIIDAFGGVDVNITKDERYWTNQYLIETRKVTGMSSPDVADYGDVHLNGLQATAFCRIRYTEFIDEDGTSYNNDFGRTARQRCVMRKLIEKAKSLGVDNVVNIANELFSDNDPSFKTSMTYDEIMDLLPVVLEFTLAGTQSFPYTYAEGNKDLIPNRASVIMAQGLTYNVTKFHEFLYPDEDYKPTTTLKNINNDISFKFQVEEIKLPEDR